MRKILAAATAAMSLFSVSAANAASLAFDFDEANSSVTVVSNTPSFCIGGTCKLSADLLDPFANLTIEEGDSATFDFVTFNVSRGFGAETDARVEAILAFITPDANSAQTGGTSSYLRLGGIFTPGLVTGSLIWDNPIQQIAALDGSLFTVQFHNLQGVTFGGNATAKVTITVDHVASAAPEPATWALLIGGFGLVGATLRRRNGALAA